MEEKNIILTVVISLIVLAVISFFGFSGIGYRYGMMGGYYGMMSGFYGFGFLFMILFVVALVLLIIWLIKQINKQ